VKGNLASKAGLNPEFQHRQIQSNLQTENAEGKADKPAGFLRDRGV
jgi:hypothetical protein